MQAGNLDRRIAIERYTTTQNEFGEEVQSWANFISVWANKKDVRDSERLAAAEVASEISTRFVVRSSDASRTIDTKDRITLDGQVFDIVGVKEIDRRKWIEISAMSRSDG